MLRINSFILLFTSTFALLALLFLASCSDQTNINDDKINLALRRTAHLLLLDSNDSTSAIDPVEHTKKNIWVVKLNNNFNYDHLPQILNSSLAIHQIHSNYDVEIINCSDGMIERGYNYYDITQNIDAPCVGRDLIPHCYNLKVVFLNKTNFFLEYRYAIVIISSLLTFALFYFFIIKYKGLSKKENQESLHPNLILFGQSSLDVAKQILICMQKHHQLTYRETKLLHFFVQNPNQVLDRPKILSHVWSDEGILVSRSLDMFVSRLRKLLRDDSSILFIAIHGVGYKLEIK